MKDIMVEIGKTAPINHHKRSFTNYSNDDENTLLMDKKDANLKNQILEIFVNGGYMNNDCANIVLDYLLIMQHFSKYTIVESDDDKKILSISNHDIDGLRITTKFLRSNTIQFYRCQYEEDAVIMTEGRTLKKDFILEYRFEPETKTNIIAAFYNINTLCYCIIGDKMIWIEIDPGGYSSYGQPESYKCDYTKTGITFDEKIIYLTQYNIQYIYATNGKLYNIEKFIYKILGYGKENYGKYNKDKTFVLKENCFNDFELPCDYDFNIKKGNLMINDGQCKVDDDLLQCPAGAKQAIKSGNMIIIITDSEFFFIKNDKNKSTQHG